MKIYQFPSPPPTRVQDKKIGGPQGGEGDFASVLKETAGQSRKPVSGGSGGIISIENQRALHIPPPVDLGLAGLLINRLKADISSSSPQTLENVHNLEGLIYVYNKNEA